MAFYLSTKNQLKNGKVHLCTSKRYRIAINWIVLCSYHFFPCWSIVLWSLGISQCHISDCELTLINQHGGGKKT